MPNFVTFNDGVSYVPISDIESFGRQDEGEYKGGTWVKLKDGNTEYTKWKVGEVAKRLGPTANLHY